MDVVPAAEIFPHMRILLGTVIGLGMARLLLTIAGMVQHPHRAKLSLLHLLWVGSLLLELVLFWWWEFALFKFSHWNFGIALFLVSYAILLFMLAALLSPDHVEDYGGYQDFFIKRRSWFFGIFAVISVFDAVDLFLKGANQWVQFGPEYLVQSGVGIMVCFIAWRSPNPRLHLVIVCTHLVYQSFLVARFFNAN